MIGAAEAVAKLSRRETSAEDLVRRCLERITAREPAVQAWEVLDAEGALAQARRIDGLRERPRLCGLPIGVKDLIDTADLPTGYGSKAHRGHRPARDAECVRRLRDAGAVIQTGGCRRIDRGSGGMSPWPRASASTSSMTTTSYARG